MPRRFPTRANPRLSVGRLQGLLAGRESFARSAGTDAIMTSSGLHVRTSQGTPAVLGNIFAVLVWTDGPPAGGTDGDAGNQCNRTYKVRTIDATAHDTGGVLLAEDIEPLKVRPTSGMMLVPGAAGIGIVGLGYYNDVNVFVLYDASESLVTDACP